MISESHSDWKRWPVALEPALPLEVVRQLTVVHDGDVGERVRPVGVCPGDVDVGLGGHADVADRVRPGELVQLVAARHGLRVAEILDDLERVAEREHLDVGHVLDEVGELLQIAVVLERDPKGVLVLLHERVHLGPERMKATLDLGPVPAQPVLVLEVAGRVGVGELVPHDHEIRRLAVERVARRVRAAVLHRLEHPGHLGPDRMLTVLVDDSCDSTHERFSSPCRSRKDVEVLVDVPVGNGGAEALPLVALVVHEHGVHLARAVPS